MNKKLNINIVIPFCNKTGGIIVVLEYYQNLIRLGHEVNIYYPLLPYWDFYPTNLPKLKKIYHLIRTTVGNIIKFKKKIAWHFEPIPVKPVLKINNIFVKNANFSIATAWPTSYDVSKLSNKKGIKLYFIQGYEIWNSPENKVNASYQLPLHLVTISPWLTDLMEKKFKRTVIAEIHNGIRLDKFFPIQRKYQNSSCSILMLFHELELKGSKEGIEALDKIIEKFPNLKITLFGHPERPIYLNSKFEYVQNPPPEELVKLYQNTDIFVSPSHTEGWQLPVMEAMACHCTVVATNVGCVPTLHNGKNIQIVKVKNALNIYRNLKLLIMDGNRRKIIAEEGYRTIQMYDWKKVANNFEKMLFFVQQNNSNCSEKTFM